jgi:predicted ATP-dependent endonuclease of OLD family
MGLSQALENAATWIRSKALQGANQGSMNVHGVYVDVLRHLITSSSSKSDTSVASNSKALIQQLDSIESRTKELACYEFATPLTTTEFRKALETRNDEVRSLAAELLDPYIKSLESRLGAVDQIYQLTDRFVKAINSFLLDKEISFTLSKGFTITNSLGHKLDPSNLSSGEQQLLLMFSFILAGRERPSMFIIDEPEISLNVKWQRQLVQSLLDITTGTEIQFIFASHSLELLSQHRKRVVKLQSTR